MITATAPAAESSPALLCMWCQGGGKDVLGVVCKRCDGTGDEPVWAMEIWNKATKSKPPTYGRTLRRARIALGLSQSEVGKVVGVGQATVSQAERGVSSIYRAKIRRALLELTAARRHWRGSDVEAPLRDAALALIRLEEPVFALWLLGAKREHLRDVLWGVTTHVLIRHPAEVNGKEDPRIGTLDALEQAVGRFDPEQENEMLDAMCEDGKWGGKSAFEWGPDSAWMRSGNVERPVITVEHWCREGA